MSKSESVNQILKEIVLKATKDYLDAPAPANLPKTNTQKNISERTGINVTTLNRYLNPNEPGSCPNLIEAMEILRVINKREALIEFGKRSNCHAAKFIKDYYGKYIDSNQIESEVLDSKAEAPLAGDVLKIINDHQDRFDKKLIRLSIVLVFGVFAFGIFNDYKTISQIDQLRESINELIKEIENENKAKN